MYIWYLLQSDAVLRWPDYKVSLSPFNRDTVFQFYYAVTQLPNGTQSRPSVRINSFLSWLRDQIYPSNSERELRTNIPHDTADRLAETIALNARVHIQQNLWTRYYKFFRKVCGFTAEEATAIVTDLFDGNPIDFSKFAVYLASRETSHSAVSVEELANSLKALVAKLLPRGSATRNVRVRLENSPEQFLPPMLFMNRAFEAIGRPGEKGAFLPLSVANIPGADFSVDTTGLERMLHKLGKIVRA